MTKPKELGPIVYEVGVDLTLTEYEDLVQQLTEWFRVSRNATDPEALARRMLDECRKGIKADGTAWAKMKDADLNTRIRAKCLYDPVQRKGLGVTREQLKARKERAKRKKAAGTWDPKRKRDPLIPAETEEILGPKAAQYGDQPHLLLSGKEEVEWHRLYQGYLKQFPELRSINASSELKIVVDLQILADRYRHRVLAGKSVDVENLTKITKELADLKKALGIHPDQIAKRVKPKTEATIGEAVAKLEAMGDYREIRARFLLEELLQIYQMYHSPRADGLGYQLDEAGFFGQTRCRTCECSGCGKRNAVGFSVEEIEAYLLEQGALEALPPLEPEEPVETKWTPGTPLPVVATDDLTDRDVSLMDLSNFAKALMGGDTSDMVDEEPPIPGSGEGPATHVDMPSDTEWQSGPDFSPAGESTATVEHVPMPDSLDSSDIEWETPPLVPDMTVDGTATFGELPPLTWDDILDEDEPST